MSFRQLIPFVACLALVIPSRASGILAGFEYNLQSFNANAEPGNDATMGSGNCWTAVSNTNNAAVVLQPCVLGSAAQEWLFIAGAPPSEGTNGTGGIGSIQIFDGMCLDVTNGVNEPGTKLQIFKCFEGNTNQMWQASTTGTGLQTFQWAGMGKCIDLTNGAQTAGTPIQIWTCITGNTHQLWFAQYATPTPPAVDGFSVQFYNNQQSGANPLLGIVSQADTNNEPVVMNRTDTAPLGVDWVYQGGTLATYDGAQCLDVTNGVDADGTLLQTFACTPGNTNQQWVFNGNYSIQWANHDKCIDLTNGVLAVGTRLQVFSCFEFNTNQQWRINPVKTESQGFGDA